MRSPNGLLPPDEGSEDAMAWKPGKPKRKRRSPRLQEIVVAPGRDISRELAVPPAIVYQEYPKCLEHPQGHDNHFPPVIVNDRNQELEYTAKGYEPPGKADAFGFLTSKATAKTDDAIRLMNEEAQERTDQIRDELFAKLDEEIKALRDENALTRGRVSKLVDEFDILRRQVSAARQKRWWQFWR